MKRIHALMLTTLLAAVPMASPAAPEVSVDIGRLYYEIGGGKALPPPGSGIHTFNITSKLHMEYGYSCGKFSYHDNISQMINQFMSQVRQIPSQLMDATSAAIAGLPSYLLMKANASLYNTVKTTLDETTELFRLSYKSCEQIEKELRADSGAYPYQGFIRASILDKWHIAAGIGKNISDADKEIKEDPIGPIVWFGGKRAGTEDNPIQVNRDFVIVGYNIMIGRTDDITSISPPTGPAAQEPIVHAWQSPAKAGRWIQEVLGDERLVLNSKKKLKSESIPGKGLRPKVKELEPEIRKALMEVYDHNDYTLINNYLALPKISGKVAEGLRTLPRGEASVLIDRLVSEMAVMEAQERLYQARQMMYAALKHPDLFAVQNVGAAASKALHGKTLPTIQDILREVRDDLEIRSRTVTPTILAIIDRANAAAKSGRATIPGVKQKEERLE